MFFHLKDILQQFKFVNWRIRGFVFWCHEQVISEPFYFFSNKIVEDTRTSKALDNQKSLLKVVNGGYVLADHSFDHMSHNSEDSPRNAYTDVEQDIVSNFNRG